MAKNKTGPYFEFLNCYTGHINGKEIKCIFCHKVYTMTVSQCKDMIERQTQTNVELDIRGHAFAHKQNIERILSSSKEEIISELHKENQEYRKAVSA